MSRRAKLLTYLSALLCASWLLLAQFQPPGGAGSIAKVTNLLQGDGAGNASDSNIPGGNVIVNTGSYANPSWITQLAWAKLTGVPSFYTTVQNNGVSLTQRSTINFQYPVAPCADIGGKTNCQLPGDLAWSTSGALLTFTTGTTNYTGTGQTSSATNDAGHTWITPVACTLANLVVYTDTGGSTGGTVVYTIFDNGTSTPSVVGTNTGITISLPASQAAGVFFDTTHTFLTAQGDSLVLQVVNNGSGNAGRLNSWTLQCQ